MGSSAGSSASTSLGAGSAGNSPTLAESISLLLAEQCQAAPAEAGALLRTSNGEVGLLAIHGVDANSNGSNSWLAKAKHIAASLNATSPSVVEPIDSASTTQSSLTMYESRSSTTNSAALMLMPLRTQGEGATLVVAYLVKGTGHTLTTIRTRLELFRGAFEALELRSLLASRAEQTQRLAGVIDAAATLGDARGFSGAAIGLCNDLCARFRCERVSLGFIRGNRVKLAAMSHTERVDKRSLLVQRLEEVMDECADQDAEVAASSVATNAGPASDFTNGESLGPVVTRCAKKFLEEHGSTGTSNDDAAGHSVASLLSVPLRNRDSVQGVVTLERATPWTQADVIDLRMTMDVISPGLLKLHETDRWFGARLVHDARNVLATVLGPRHTWAKALVIALSAFVLGTLLIKGTYKVEGSFTLEAPIRQAVPAPFDGFLRQALVRPNDQVTAGVTVMAQLDDSDLRVEAAALVAEREARLKEADKARSERKTSDALVSEAEAQRVAARLELVQAKLSRASILAPISGTVLTGELDQLIGSPIKTGDVLFEVAPLGELRADVAVLEDQIADVRVGQTGELATAAYPGEYVGFVVERIDPIAKLDKSKNVFNVRVKLTNTPESIASSLRPGMQGLAKIESGKKPYASLWTRRLVNWVRMKLWI